MSADDYLELVKVDPSHYVPDAEIARGGMGRIRTARDRRLGRTVALKEVLTTRDDIALRFEREARITARLEHPAIVSVHEAGSWPSGEPFIAMRLVKGASLDEVVDKARTFAERLALVPNVLAIADAMAYAHSQRVIHRDLKPKNVLVGNFGETVVIDWGLAKDMSDRRDAEVPTPPAPTAIETLPTVSPAASGTTQLGHAKSGIEDTVAAMTPSVTGTEPTISSSEPTGTITKLTMAGAVMGTPAYMPPEQARGESVDARADVYSIGAILYHVLTGSPPIRARNVDQALDDAIQHRVIPLAKLEPNTPIDLLAIANKAMSRVAADRYPTAKELADDLRRFQTGQLVGAHRYSLAQLIGKWIRRHRAIVAVSAVTLAILTITAIISVRRVIAERERADAARKLAEEARTSSEALVEFMSGDLKEQLQPLGRLDLLQNITAKAVDYYTHADSTTPAMQSRRGSAIMLRAEVLDAVGNLAGAVAEVRNAIAVRGALVSAEPAVVKWQRELASSHRSLSDLLRRQDDREGALAEAESGLGITEVVAQTLPHDRDVEADLAASHTAVGNALWARGDTAAALAAYETALARRTRLAASAADLDGQRVDLILLEKISALLVDRDDIPGALAKLRTALAAAEALVARDRSNNAACRRDVAILQTKLGNALVLAKDHAPALAAFRAAQAIQQRLVEEQPQVIEYQRDVSVSHANLGRTLSAAGDHDAALDELRKDLAIAKALATRDPMNAKWQRDLSVSYESLAAALLAAKRPRDALAEVQASLIIAKQLAARDATNVFFQAELARTYEELVKVHTALGDSASAQAATAEAKRIRATFE